MADAEDPKTRSPETGSLLGTPRVSGKVRQVILLVWTPLVTIAAFLLLLSYMSHRVGTLPPGNDPAAQGLQLKTLIRQVKTELQQADMEAIKNGEPALFQLKDFELDVNVVAKGSITGNAQIVTVGSSAEVSSERVQRIHLRWVVDPEAQKLAIETAKIDTKATRILDGDAP